MLPRFISFTLTTLLLFSFEEPTCCLRSANFQVDEYATRGEKGIPISALFWFSHIRLYVPEGNGTGYMGSRIRYQGPVSRDSPCGRRNPDMLHDSKRGMFRKPLPAEVAVSLALSYLSLQICCINTRCVCGGKQLWYLESTQHRLVEVNLRLTPERRPLFFSLLLHEKPLLNQECHHHRRGES